MIFKNLEEAKKAYARFAHTQGFGTRIRYSGRNKAGRISRIKMVCVREGQTQEASKDKFYHRRPSARQDCPAYILFRLVGEIIVVKEYKNIHNHPMLPPEEVKFLPCLRRLSFAQQRTIQQNDKSGISASQTMATFASEVGGHHNLTFTEQDVRNFISKVRRLNLGVGDAKALQEYFISMQRKHPNFFYVLDLDDTGVLRNVFWADSRSRAAYKYFGDIVTFDTTYLTNKYKMPFAPFVGVNHHGQSILLGCGLICEETTDNFIWLFKTWLSCMEGMVCYQYYLCFL